MYTMSHHVVHFMERLAGHLQEQHRLGLSPALSSRGMGSITTVQSTVDDVSSLLDSDGDDSDFGLAA